MSRISIPALVTQLAHDGVAVAQAEIAFARTKLMARVAGLRTGIILLVVAAIVALLGLVGLVVGCVLALAPLVGAGFAGLIVLAVTLVIAGILALIGVRRLSASPQPAVDPHAPVKAS